MWEFTAKKADRLDRVLREAALPGAEWLSRQAWDFLLESGRVAVNGQLAKKAGARVEAGAQVKVSLPEGPLGLRPAREPAILLWANEARTLAAFRKDPGVDTVPLLPWEEDAFANQVAAYLEQNGWMPAAAFAALADPPHLEGGTLQRLDRDTSGLVLVALDAATKASWRRAFADSRVEKSYLALLTGNAAGLAGERRVWLAGSSGPKVKASASAPRGEAEEISLHVEVLETGAATLVRVRTRQGARHVVRAGLACLGFPLVGDALYGGSPAHPYHLLHAEELVATGLPRLLAPPPESFLDSVSRLGLHWKG